MRKKDLAQAHTASTAQAHPAAHEAPAHEDTSTGLNTRKLLMWTFLASDVMFFGSLIAAYLIYRNQSLVGPYPPEVLDIPITSISTFVLLMSSLSMVLALHYIKAGESRTGRLWILATAALGSVFLLFQVYEFNAFVHEGLTPRTNLFGTTFFTLTGFHGAHVTFGVAWLLAMAIVATPGRRERIGLLLGVGGFYTAAVGALAIFAGSIPPLDNAVGLVMFLAGSVVAIAGSYNLITADKAQKTPISSLDIEISGLYWHFVDIVWIVIFTVIYLISANDPLPVGAALHGG